MSGPSTSQMEVEENVMRERDIKINKLIKIINVGEFGVEKFKEINKDLDEFVIDVDLSDEISGFLLTVYTCLSKE